MDLPEFGRNDDEREIAEYINGLLDYGLHTECKCKERNASGAPGQCDWCAMSVVLREKNEDRNKIQRRLDMLGTELSGMLAGQRIDQAEVQRMLGRIQFTMGDLNQATRTYPASG